MQNIISKKTITAVVAVALALVVAVGALAGTVASKVFAEPNLVGTSDTHLLPGRYRNTPQYFYSLYDTTETNPNGTVKQVYVPAKHGDNLINSYEINSDGSIEILVQEGRVVFGGYNTTARFTDFGVYYINEEGEEVYVDLVDEENDPIPVSGIYEITIPAYAAPESVTDPIKIEFSFVADPSPTPHTSEAYLILSPELVQVAYTYPIPATFPNP
ncbi:MAG: hypothetical protein LBD49_05395 [Oscillospiraceae bacterium]|nr:hypothetical protein [Oscillospiraceae bacterium]